MMRTQICAVLLTVALFLGISFAYPRAMGPSDGAIPARLSATDSGWHEERRWVMGTQLRVVIVSRFDEIQDVMDAAFEEAQRWDALLSHYDPLSPLSRINAYAGETVEIPHDLFIYLTRAKNDCERTDGIFDITVGPLVNAHRQTSVTPAELNDAIARVGMDKFDLFQKGNHYFARLIREGMSLDPGGDGKGVAVDAVVDVIRNAGVTIALIDFGGSTFYGLGSPAGSKGWPIAVQDSGGGSLGTVFLQDQALSVSASLKRDLSFEESGPETLEGHIVDPRNGALVTVPRSAVVLSQKAVDAEVLSTVLVVEGEAGYRFYERFAASPSAIFRPGRTHITHCDFDRYFEPPAPPSF